MVEPVPQKRTRQFSFTSYTLTQPTKPLPGNKVDDEVDKTNAVLNDVIDFIRQAIADDGTIRLEALDESTYIVATGPQGPAGPAFQPNATGNTADRSLYDAQPQGYAFLDTQANPPLLYFRQTATPGVWSAPVIFNNGPQGIQGPDGPPGTPGVNGATIRIITAGTPAPTLGADGDLTVNAANGNLWQKSGGVWTLQGNLRGPQGIPGPTGATGQTGPVGPQGPAGTTIPRASNTDALGGTVQNQYIDPASLKFVLDNLFKFRNLQIFTASGTFDPPPGVTELFAIVVSGGTGGGNGGANSTPGTNGQGGSLAAFKVAASPSMPVVVGAGGNAANLGGGASSFGGVTTGPTSGNSSSAAPSITAGNPTYRARVGGTGGQGIPVDWQVALWAAPGDVAFVPLAQLDQQATMRPRGQGGNAVAYDPEGTNAPGAGGQGGASAVTNNPSGGVGGAVFIFY